MPGVRQEGRRPELRSWSVQRGMGVLHDEKVRNPDRDDQYRSLVSL